MEEVRIKDGKYWVRVGDKAHRISKAQYDQIVWANSMEEARPEGLGEQLLLGASKRGTDIMDAGIDAYARLTNDQALAHGITQLRRDELDRYQAGTGMAEQVGELGVDLATYGVPAAGAARVAGVGALQQLTSQGLAAGGTGFLTTPGTVPQRLEQGGQDLMFTGLGTASGIALERIINRLRGHRLDLTQQQRKAGEALDAGMQMSPGAVTGPGNYQRAVEPWLESAGYFSKARNANDERYQLLTGRALGMSDNAIDLSAEGLGMAEQQIGKLFDVLDGTQIKLSPEQSAKLQGMGNLSEYFSFPGKRDYLTGNEYKRIRRQLSELARRDFANPAAPAGRAEAITDFRKMLDLKFQKEVGPEGARKFKVARERWKIFETIQRGAALTPDGAINPASMRAAVNSQWGKTLRRAKYGNVEPETREWLQAVNQYTSQFAKPAVGSSGTAERSGLGFSNAFWSQAIPAGAAAAGYYANADEPTLLGVLLSAGGAGFATNRLLANYGSLGAFTSRAGQIGQFGGPAAVGLMGIQDEEQ